VSRPRAQRQPRSGRASQLVEGLAFRLKTNRFSESHFPAMRMDGLRCSEPRMSKMSTVLNIQHSTLSTQHSTLSTQHSTLNTQHSHLTPLQVSSVAAAEAGAETVAVLREMIACFEQVR